MSMDPVHLQKAWDDCREQADQLPCIEVQAEVRTQAGQQILVASCPKCRTPAGLAGPGRHLCRTCHTLLKYVPKT